MQIAGYLKTSLIEWEGKICSVIFTPGCSFRCPFCHNPDLVAPKKGKKIPSFKEEEVLADLASRKKWVDALVITGGEPTLQKDLADFLKKVKENNFSVMIHTNGTSPEAVRELIANKLVDYFCLDLKNSFENYAKTANAPVDLKKIKESIKLIISSGREYEFRTTIVPGLHDLKSLGELAEEVREIFVNCKLKTDDCRWFLQQFNNKNCVDPKYQKIDPYPVSKLKEFQKEIAQVVPQPELRGV